MTQTLRLFTALWPDDEVRRQLVAWQQAVAWSASARRVAPEKLHVTVNFLGQVPRSSLPAIREAMRVEASPVRLRFDRFEVWRGGIAVLEVGSVPAELVELHRLVSGRLEAAGFAMEARPYRPHVTLGRHAVGSAIERPTTSVDWNATEIVLVEST